MKTTRMLFKTIFLSMFALIIFLLPLSAQNEADFYTEKNHLVSTTKSIIDFGAIANDNIDDSDALQDAIDDASSQTNGGIVNIPSGTFYLKQIYLKSNVHIVIDKDAIIKITPWEDPDNLKNYALFYLNVKNALVENVSIRCAQEDERYTIDFRALVNPNVRAFQLNNTQNFYVADFNVIDDITKFSCVTFGTEDYSPSPDGWNAPTNGIIKNGDVRGAHYGYGLVQAQAANNVLFKNLSGQGGVTLRFETGYDKMNELQIGGLFDCYGRDIYCEDGNAAYMMSPHAIQNGHVDIQGVKSVNCGFAVRIGNGYVKNDQQDLPGVSPGTFAATSIVKDVEATYGGSAQVKSKHFKYMPCELRHLISDDYNPDGESYSAPSIVALYNGAEGVGEGYFNVNVSDVSATGFAEQPKAIIYEEDAVEDCSVTSVPNNDEYRLVSVGPNPFTDDLQLIFNPNHTCNYIELIDLSGKTVYSQNINAGSVECSLSLSHIELPKGVYILILHNETGYNRLKVVKA